MCTYELFEVPGGYGFHILSDGNPIIRQEYMPDADGFVTMNEEEARNWAEIIVNRVKGE